MKSKHLTSKTGHVIINGFFGSACSRKALIYKDTNQDLCCEFWDTEKLLEVREFKGHNIYYVEDAAVNWVSNVNKKNLFVDTDK
jgi:hypothetical protein